MFVVTCGAYPSDQEVAGVYSTRELAQERADKVTKAMRMERSWDSQTAQYCSIDEYALDGED